MKQHSLGVRFKLASTEIFCPERNSPCPGRNSLSYSDNSLYPAVFQITEYETKRLFLNLLFLNRFGSLLLKFDEIIHIISIVFLATNSLLSYTNLNPSVMSVEQKKTITWFWLDVQRSILDLCGSNLDLHRSNHI